MEAKLKHHRHERRPRPRRRKAKKPTVDTEFLQPTPSQLWTPFVEPFEDPELEGQCWSEFLEGIDGTVRRLLVFHIVVIMLTSFAAALAGFPVTAVAIGGGLAVLVDLGALVGLSMTESQSPGWIRQRFRLILKTFVFWAALSYGLRLLASPAAVLSLEVLLVEFAVILARMPHRDFFPASFALHVAWIGGTTLTGLTYDWSSAGLPRPTIYPTLTLISGAGWFVMANMIAASLERRHRTAFVQILDISRRHLFYQQLLHTLLPEAAVRYILQKSQSNSSLLTRNSAFFIRFSEKGAKAGPPVSSMTDLPGIELISSVTTAASPVSGQLSSTKSAGSRSTVSRSRSDAKSSDNSSTYLTNALRPPTITPFIFSYPDATAGFVRIGGLQANLDVDHTAITIVHEVICLLDDICQSVGIEKVKTVSTMYIVTSINRGKASAEVHLAAMLQFAVSALSMIATTNERTGAMLTLSIGVDQGSVAGGIIGTEKFMQYNVWGRAVISAARSSCLKAPPNSIVMPASLWSRIPESPRASLPATHLPAPAAPGMLPQELVAVSFVLSSDMGEVMAPNFPPATPAVDLPTPAVDLLDPLGSSHGSEGKLSAASRDGSSVGSQLDPSPETRHPFSVPIGQAASSLGRRSSPEDSAFDGLIDKALATAASVMGDVAMVSSHFAVSTWNSGPGAAPVLEEAPPSAPRILEIESRPSSPAETLIGGSGAPYSLPNPAESSVDLGRAIFRSELAALPSRSEIIHPLSLKYVSELSALEEPFGQSNSVLPVAYYSFVSSYGIIAAFGTPHEAWTVHYLLPTAVLLLSALASVTIQLLWISNRRWFQPRYRSLIFMHAVTQAVLLVGLTTMIDKTFWAKTRSRQPLPEHLVCLLYQPGGGLDWYQARIFGPLWGLAAAAVSLWHGVPIISSWFFCGLVAVVMTSSYQAESEARLKYLIEARGQYSHHHSEEILHSMLPRPIFKELRKSQSHGMIAFKFPDAAVLTIEIVDYDTWSSQRVAADVVRVLNQLWSALDMWASEIGVTRIKTVSGSYMAAVGIDATGPEQAAALVLFVFGALELLEDVNHDLGTRLHFRMGIGTGPVSGGILGKVKFSFDLWGQPVTTSRTLCQEAAPDQTLVQSAFAGQLRAAIQHDQAEPVRVAGSPGANPNLFFRNASFRLLTTPRPDVLNLQRI